MPAAGFAPSWLTPLPGVVKARSTLPYGPTSLGSGGELVACPTKVTTLNAGSVYVNVEPLTPTALCAARERLGEVIHGVTEFTMLVVRFDTLTVKLMA